MNRINACKEIFFVILKVSNKHYNILTFYQIFYELRNLNRSSCASRKLAKMRFASDEILRLQAQ